VNGEIEWFTEIRGFAHIVYWSQLEEVVKNCVTGHRKTGISLPTKVIFKTSDITDFVRTASG
jgi:hypothetical protein